MENGTIVKKRGKKNIAFVVKSNICKGETFEKCTEMIKNNGKEKGKRDSEKVGIGCA